MDLPAPFSSTILPNRLAFTEKTVFSASVDINVSEDMPHIVSIRDCYFPLELITLKDTNEVGPHALHRQIGLFDVIVVEQFTRRGVHDDSSIL